MRRIFEKINQRSANVAVIGLGYVGLPLAVTIAHSGFPVFGLDLDPQKIKNLQKGHSHSPDVDDRTLREMIFQERLQPSSDFEVLKQCDFICLCVPVPLDTEKNPAFSSLDRAISQVKKILRPHQVLLIESTLPPGTFEERIAPSFQEGPLKIGEEFFLIYSPERLDPGNRHFKVHNIPKLVSGFTPACLEIGLAFYQTFIEKVIPIQSPRVVELSRILENTFRAVNIAFINEFSEMCVHLKVDIQEVLEAAASKPFGFMRFDPGPGVGGNCVPVAPQYLGWALKSKNYESSFLQLTDKTNGARPQKVIQKTKEALLQKGRLLEGAQILILGMAYKRDIDDVRFSPALEVMRGLQKEGAEVDYHDPFVPKVFDQGLWTQSVGPPDHFGRYDAVLLLTDHSCWNIPRIVKESQLFVDTRQASAGLKDSKDNIIKV